MQQGTVLRVTQGTNQDYPAEPFRHFRNGYGRPSRGLAIHADIRVERVNVVKAVTILVF